MENASEALKMAGAVLIFVVAITITIMAFSKARQASTSIMALRDKYKTFYNVEDENVTAEKIVDIDAVISNIYSYYQTQNTIVFYTGNLIGGNLTNVKKMPLYRTKAEKKLINRCSLSVAYDSDLIYGIDINDEAIREEQWVAHEERRKQFADFLINAGCRISGSFYNKIPDKFFDNSKPRGIEFEYQTSTYMGHSFINSKAQFIERIGEYNRDLKSVNSNAVTDEGDEVGQFSGLDIESSIISFEEVDERLDNSKGDKKRVIEYIYIGEKP